MLRRRYYLIRPRLNSGFSYHTHLLIHLAVNMLFGRWRLVAADTTLGLDAQASLHFKPNGELLYLIPEADRLSAIRLVYRVEGSQLVTDQPSAPREQRTEFELDGDQLILKYQGGRARFRRERSAFDDRAS
jgi:hypothetical protein